MAIKYLRSESRQIEQDAPNWYLFTWYWSDQTTGAEYSASIKWDRAAERWTFEGDRDRLDEALQAFVDMTVSLGHYFVRPNLEV